MQNNELKECSKMLRKCPFCGGEAIYETKRENEIGTIIPQLFCNCCKMIFEIENDSPYLNDDKTYDYLKEKLHNLWNTRKPMERIVERLEESLDKTMEENSQEWDSYYRKVNVGKCVAFRDAIEIVKEEGGMNE